MKKIPPKVSIVRCPNYEQEKVDQAIRKSLNLIGGIEKIVKPKDRVLLKVNILNADPPEKAVTTHPAVLRATIKLLKEAKAEVLVGEDPGIAYGDPEKAWKISGLKQAAVEEGAQVVSFRRGRQVNFPHNKQVSTLYIAQEVMEADLVISLPKLKTHNFTLFTGAIKNLYGTIPGFQKKELHALAPRPVDFAQLMVDIFSLIKPGLAIMDGIVGMEGDGPAAGPPRQIGVVLASEDLVALDAVSSSIIGYNPRQIDSTRIAHQRNLGVGKLEEIEIVGASLEKVKIPDFKLASSINVLLNRLPNFLISTVRHLAPLVLKVRPLINKEKCAGCGICVKHCPTGAISQTNRDYPKINYQKCIKCLCCQEFCPQRAISIQRSWLSQKLKI